MHHKWILFNITSLLPSSFLFNTMNSVYMTKAIQSFLLFLTFAPLCLYTTSFCLQYAQNIFIMLQLCLRGESSFLWVLTFTGRKYVNFYSQSEELHNMIEGDKAASRPLFQSPVNVSVIPLINMLKTVNHCSTPAG